MTFVIVAAAMTAIAMGVFVVVPASLAKDDAYTYAASSGARLPSICMISPTRAASPLCNAPARASRADSV